MKHKFCLLYAWLVWAVTFFVPDVNLMTRFRGWLYSLVMPKCGKNFQVSAGARLFGLNNLYVGSNVYIATNVVINACDHIILEDEVMVGINSTLVSGNHTIKDGSYRFGSAQRAPIKVGHGSWVSGNVLLIAGAEIPPSSLVAGGAVVNKKHIESGIYGGVPAKLISSSQKN